MKLTICLVTRGRSQFLDDCLLGLEECLHTGLAEVLLFDNGAPLEVSHTLETWCQKNNVEHIRYDENDSRPTRVWNEVRSRGFRWVVFPGDDDKFIASSLRIFRDTVGENSDLSAIAFNMNTIDVNGKNLHRIRKPSYQQYVPQHIAVARSFHEPPFLWPSLFFRADLIGSSAPTSRFYFDWWVGQNLIIKGNVAIINDSSIQYRIHPLQESNLADNRRKYFEATHWAISFIESESFLNWIRNLTKEELIDFWNSMLLYQPIYSSDYFGGQILERISKVLLNARPEFDLFAEVIGSLAASKGVWLRSGELNNLTSIGSTSKKSFPPNFSVSAVPGSCSTLTIATEEFTSSLSPAKNHLVSCNHTSMVKSYIRFDCNQFENLENDQIMDQIIFQLSKKAEELGEFDFITSGTEKSLILLLRRVKAAVPGRVLTFFRLLVSRRESGK